MRSKNIFLSVVTNLVMQVIMILYGLIIPKIIINIFGSNVNGLINSITQFLAYIVLLESGFGPVVKAALYKPISKKDKSTIEKILKTSEKFFRKVSIIFLLYILILAILFPLIVEYEFGYFYTFTLVFIISISTFSEYFFGMTYRLYLQAEQKSYIISIIQIIVYIISIIVVILMAKMNFSIHFIKLMASIIFILRPLLQNVYVKKKFNINLKNVNEEYLLEQKWDGLAQHIAYVIHSNTDIVVLTLFSTLKEVSVYSIYYLVVKGIKSIISGFLSGIDASFGNMLAKNEDSNLRKKFGIYENIYLLICTIVFAATMVLIVPFIEVYISGINDADYIRYLFGPLIVISEFIWAVRQPYNELIKAACHFKETRKGAWVECLINIIISIILVKKYGIVGVALGTIVAMTIRTIEFVYHTNKYILNRNICESLKKILLIIIETFIIVLICKYLPYLNNISYLNWFINAIMVVFVASFIVISFNMIFFKKELVDVFSIITGLLKKNNSKQNL